MRKAFLENEAAPAPVLRDYDADVAREAVTAPNGKEIFSLAQVIDQLTRPNVAWTGVDGNPMPKGGIGTITFAFFELSNQV